MSNLKDPEIIYEDDLIIAVSKPAGMIVNKADTTKNQYTLQHFSEKKINIKKIIQSYKNKKKFLISGYNKFAEFISRGGIVHRLDKETSGIILIAKTPEMFMNLQEQFRKKTIHKKYIALVHGFIKKEEGKIDAPIGRLPWNRMRFGVLESGRFAVTYYKVVARKVLKTNKKKEEFTLVDVFPQTGRTHQIRVHFKYIGHPIFADELYAGRKTGRDDRNILPRHFLHAAEITFKHPLTLENMTIKSELPLDLKNFLNSLDNIFYPQ